jgi:hypothetical protein
MLIFEVIIMFFMTPDEIANLGIWAKNAECGNIYPKYDGAFYAIQLVGTAAIPFLVMLSHFCELFPRRYEKLIRIVYIVATIIAGNFAYIISLAAFYIVLYVSKINNKRRLAVYSVIAVIILSFALKPAINFVTTTMESKKEVSNAIRVEQTNVLLDDMSYSLGTFLFGTGLGHTVNRSAKFRNYAGVTYYELQSLYFLNQMGLIPFLIFICVNIVLSIKNIRRKDLLFVYMCYVMYSVTNPYIFNTNQVVVIVSLVSVYKSYVRKLDCQKSAKNLKCNN